MERYPHPVRVDPGEKRVWVGSVDDSSLCLETRSAVVAGAAWVWFELVRARAPRGGSPMRAEAESGSVGSDPREKQ